MNIVRWIGRKHVLTVITLIALSAVGIQLALTPKRIRVRPDIRWSTPIQETLKKIIKAQALRTIGARGLRESLVTDFPCLQDVAIRYNSSLIATVSLSSWQPRIVLCSSLPGNKVYVVCEKGIVLDKNYFSVEAVQGLPNIVIEGADFEDKRKAPELIEMALTIDPEVVEQHDITWHNKTNISLRNTEHPIVITADHVSIHYQKRYSDIMNIFETELEEKSSLRKYRRGMKVDMRLKDSLICSPARLQ